MSSTEKDLSLKLRTMRYLWHLGYFVRRNVDLVEYGFEKARTYTDIDVLGVKMDESLFSAYVVCDCKSGITVKTPERLFWLSGVMTYFGADEGLFIRNTMMESKYLALSRRLRIAPVSTLELSDLEKTYAIPDRFFGPFCEEQGNTEAIFSELKKEVPLVHDYILKRYWKDTPSQQIVTLISHCHKIKEIRRLEDFKQTFVLAYAFSLLSLSTLQLAKTVLMIPSDQREMVAKYELLGGEEALADRTKLMGRFYDFMVNEILQRYKEKFPVTKSQFLESLLPEYSKHFADLMLRFCQNPASSIFVPRMMDLLAFEFALNNRKVSFDDVASSRNRISLKPFKDFLVFANRSGLTTSKFEETASEFSNVLEGD
jgi:hypothetical protein